MVTISAMQKFYWQIRMNLYFKIVIFSLLIMRANKGVSLARKDCDNNSHVLDSYIDEITKRNR